MDGKYGSLENQKRILSDNNRDRIHPKPKSLGIGVVLIVLIVVLIIVFLVGLLYWRVAPSTIRSRTLIQNSNNVNTDGDESLVGDGTLGSFCINDSNCGSGFECSADQCCFFGDPIITNTESEVGLTSAITITYDFGPSISPGTAVEVVLESPTGVQLANKVEEATGMTTIEESDFSVPIKIIFPDTPYVAKVRVTYTCGSRQNFTSDFSSSVTFNTVSCGLDPSPAVITDLDTSIGLYNSHIGTVAIGGNILVNNATILVSSSPGRHPNLSDDIYQNNLQEVAVLPGPTIVFYYALPFLANFGDTVYARAYIPANLNLLELNCISNLGPEITHVVGT